MDALYVLFMLGIIIPFGFLFGVFAYYFLLGSIRYAEKINDVWWDVKMKDFREYLAILLVLSVISFSLFVVITNYVLSS